MKDDDKKPLDNNAVNQKKNRLAEKNRQAGKNQNSKKPDHLFFAHGCLLQSKPADLIV